MLDRALRGRIMEIRAALDREIGVRVPAPQFNPYPLAQHPTAALTPPKRKSRRLSRTLALSAISASAGTFAPTGATSLPSHESIVTIKVDRDTEVFRGRVISTSPHCYVGRAVRVFRVRSGQDLYITRTFTNEAGKWRAIIPAQHAKHVYAKVREETVPPGGRPRARCSGDLSRTIVG
jgi:hypothetical protein